MIIINANAFLDAREFRMSDLIIEDGKIIRILPAGSADPFEPEVINLQGAKLYPGFIDLQINGCGGEEQAKTMEKNFRKKAEAYYQQFIEMLSKK